MTHFQSMGLAPAVIGGGVLVVLAAVEGLASSIDHSCSTYAARCARLRAVSRQPKPRRAEPQENSRSSLPFSFSPCSLIESTKTVSEMLARRASNPLVISARPSHSAGQSFHMNKFCLLSGHCVVACGVPGLPPGNPAVAHLQELLNPPNSGCHPSSSCTQAIPCHNLKAILRLA